MANSIKDLIGSVDWRKMLSNADTRNAAIGTALGATLLGGAGLLQKRDPEESKLAPVGDALMGAVLGGVAGYGIPKGLSLFRDPGALAPDGDVLKSNYLGWGAGGALAGAGVVGGSLWRTLNRAKDDRLRVARKELGKATGDALSEMVEASRNNEPLRVQRRLQDRFKMLMTDPQGREEAEQILSRYRGKALKSLLRGDTKNYSKYKGMLDDLVNYRNETLRGYRGFRDLLRHAAGEAITPSSKPVGAFGWLRDKLLRTAVKGPGFTHGAHYAPKPLFGVIDKIPLPKGRFLHVSSPMARVALRGGKYALGGTALALLAHKLIGPSASNNYKN